MKKRFNFKDFTAEELYVLKRAFAESSCEFAMGGNYTDRDLLVHGELLNEVVECIKDYDDYLTDEDK